MRKLTIRERVLLICLAIVAAVSGYVLLFYMPMTRQAQAFQTRIEEAQTLNLQLETRLTEQQQMQAQTVQLTNQGGLPTMPTYNNLQAVMVELNSILADCQEFSISFQGDETVEDNIFRRQVTIPFVCADYDTAQRVLRRLHDAPLRCLLKDVQLTQEDGGAVSVTASVTFFEYQPSTD